MHALYAYIDPLIIWLYRITGYTFVDFLIGTFVLAMIALVIGEFTISLAFLANRREIEKYSDEAVRFQNISVDAIEAGNKKIYKAANKVANEAFGKSFFQQIALSTGFLWPIPFALGWMQYRFADVDFRVIFTDFSVGYAFLFVPLYALAYLVFKRIKYRLPYFRRVKALLDAAEMRHREMRTFADLMPQTNASGGANDNG
jgi:hypothetical protein